jgi:hypothetical protein
MLKDGQTYAGRREDVVVINASVSREAAAVLRLYAPPGRKSLGRFLERLLFEYHGKQAEQSRILGAILPKN